MISAECNESNNFVAANKYVIIEKKGRIVKEP